jgi:beta-N-acetylhexosaminidase
MAAFLLPFLLACRAPDTGQARLAREAASLLEGMSDAQKVGQLFMVSIPGSRTVGAKEAETLARYQPGALILFGFNVSGGSEATRAFTASIQDSLSQSPVPALIAIDHEGGAVFRFKDSLTRLPSAREVAARLSIGETQTLGELAGAELRALGITLNLAPIAEPSGEWNKAFLGDRAYSAEPDRAADYASAFAQGMKLSRVASTLKHFPGNALADPHKGLPVLDLPAEEVQRLGVGVFKRAILLSGADCVMLSHVLVPALDGSMPASLSPTIVDILRKKLQFKGIILTDDLEMKALSSERPVSLTALMAVEAGADMLILSTQDGLPAAHEAILGALGNGSLSRGRLDEAVLRILRLKLSLDLAQERDAGVRQAAFAALPRSLDESRKFVNDRFR